MGGRVRAGDDGRRWAGHLARSVLQVECFLDGRVTGAELVSAVRYYARLTSTDQPGSDLNTGVRARSAETAAEGPAVVAEQALAACRRLTRRLAEESLPATGWPSCTGPARRCRSTPTWRTAASNWPHTWRTWR
ncbi:hypothetical protein ACH5AU_05350 [Streptomyces albidoflavus]